MSLPYPPKKLRLSTPTVRAVTADTLLPTPQSSCQSPSPSLNRSLGNGLPLGRVTQFSGQTLSGKTAIASSFAASILSAGHGVVWLETTHSVWEVTTRLTSQVQQNPSNNQRQVQLPLMVFAIPTLESAKEALSALRSDILLLNNLIPEKEIDDASVSNLSIKTLARLRLVVFDSVAAILSPLLGLRVPPAWSGHVAMDEIASALRWFTVRRDISVIVTNRVVSGTGNLHPGLGNKWTAFVDVNVMLNKEDSAEQALLQPTDNSDKTVLDVSVNSKRDYPRSCKVMISASGVSDVHQL